MDISTIQQTRSKLVKGSFITYKVKNEDNINLPKKLEDLKIVFFTKLENKKISLDQFRTTKTRLRKLFNYMKECMPTQEYQDKLINE